MVRNGSAKRRCCDLDDALDGTQPSKKRRLDLDGAIERTKDAIERRISAVECIMSGGELGTAVGKLLGAYRTEVSSALTNYHMVIKLKD